MKKLITAPLAAAALFVALAGAAAAAPAAPHAANDARAIGISRIAAPAPQPRDESGIDRRFQPDYADALTVDQENAAWDDEINRVFETPITGGG
jgi:hypothetical protein